MSEESSSTGLDSPANGTVEVAKAEHSIPLSPRPETAPGGPGGEDVLLFLVGARLLNTVLVKTFFQPDEYFQSLEPAWQLAFGANAGAWITWEWKEHLRSALHPMLFALAYQTAGLLGSELNLNPETQAQLLLLAPKVVQSIIAALGDYYTWKLAENIYGPSSIASAATLMVTVASPWQWFCATRTFSNSLETTLTIVALYNWPWHWSVVRKEASRPQIDEQGLRVRNPGLSSSKAVDETSRLRRALLFAALATILRPTNILIWLALTVLTFLRGSRVQWLARLPGTNLSGMVDVAGWSFVPSKEECLTFGRETIFCGSAVLAFSAVVDRFFYQTWTFPPFNFLYFNVAQSIAIFYGNNNWHYYISQGYPLLLTTALPFAVMGIAKTFSKAVKGPVLPKTAQNTLSSLAIVSIFVPSTLSIISHKEVRFIYPLLPALHILAAGPLSNLLRTVFDPPLHQSKYGQFSKQLLLFSLLLINLSISLYTSIVHNSGLIAVTDHLRTEFQQYYHPTSSNLAYQHSASNMTVAFLMPCHSTPWRSHIQYPPTSSQSGIDAWALSCEPPLNLNETAKSTYLDEADQFYADPTIWLKRHMSRHPPSPPVSYNGTSQNRRTREPGIFAAAAETDRQDRSRRMFAIDPREEEMLWRQGKSRRPWPEYLVFFEQLEPLMKRAVARGGGYTECKRIWNSHWHDDWRREGDVVVWCLYPERAESAVMERKRELEKVEAGKANVKKEMEKNKNRESVVEKPFWKQRNSVKDATTDVKKRNPWEWLMDKLGYSTSKKRSSSGSWWRGGKWS